jgi:citrate synthase
MATLIDAAETVKRLGITKPTLYAYVSRGQIRAVPDSGDPRRRLYRADDVEALLARKRRGRKLESVARSTLDWGPPILDSAITLIRDGQIYYRGHDARDLAAGDSVETVARLLWDCGATDPFADDGMELPEFTDGMLARLASLAPVERFAAILPLAEAATFAGGTRNSARLWEDAARLVRMLAAAALGVQPSPLSLPALLARAWRLAPGQADFLRTALIFCADHELNVSTFTVRCVASTGAGLPASILAGLAALSGPLHGGMIARVEALLDKMRDPHRPRPLNDELAEATAEDGQGPRRIITARLRRGEALPGFGHPLYPDGDPRGLALIERLPPGDPHREFAGLVEALGGDPPNLDFGLVATARHLGLPAGAGFTLFAIGRSIGWIAHALEQRTQPGPIRPRAQYVGMPPS